MNRRNILSLTSTVAVGLVAQLTSAVWSAKDNQRADRGNLDVCFGA